MTYDVGSIVQMKKNHPCKKSIEWEVTRVGADIKIKCLGCNNIIMMPRREFDKKLKKVIK